MYTNAKDKSLKDRVLAVMREHKQAVMARYIAEKIGETLPTVTAALQHLNREGHVSFASQRHDRRKASLWSIVEVQSGPSRYIPSRQTFTGVDWSASTMRPGCMDHTKFASRRGDDYVPYTGKLIHAVSSAKYAPWIDT